MIQKNKHIYQAQQTTNSAKRTRHYKYSYMEDIEEDNVRTKTNTVKINKEKFHKILEKVKMLKKQMNQLNQGFNQCKKMNSELIESIKLISDKYENELNKLKQINKGYQDNQKNRLLNQQQKIVQQQQHIEKIPDQNTNEDGKQKEIQSLRQKIKSLNIIIDLKSEQNKGLNRQLKKYTLFCNKEKDDIDQSRVQIQQIQPTDDINILAIKQPNSQYTVRISDTNRQRSKTKNESYLNSKNQASNTKSIDKIQTSSRSREKERQSFRNQLKNYSSFTKSSNNQEYDKSIVKKQFQTALKNYNMGKKSRIEYYYK